MDGTISLVLLEERFERYMVGQQRSDATRTHYKYTFKDFHQFLAETDRPATLASLNVDSIREFSIWLADTPTRAWRRSTTRVGLLHAAPCRSACKGHAKPRSEGETQRRRSPMSGQSGRG